MKSVFIKRFVSNTCVQTILIYFLPIFPFYSSPLLSLSLSLSLSLYLSIYLSTPSKLPLCHYRDASLCYRCARGGNYSNASVSSLIIFSYILFFFLIGWNLPPLYLVAQLFIHPFQRLSSAHQRPDQGSESSCSFFFTLLPPYPLAFSSSSISHTDTPPFSLTHLSFFVPYLDTHLWPKSYCHSISLHIALFWPPRPSFFFFLLFFYYYPKNNTLLFSNSITYTDLPIDTSFVVSVTAPGISYSEPFSTPKTGMCFESHTSSPQSHIIPVVKYMHVITHEHTFRIIFLHAFTN